MPLCFTMYTSCQIKMYDVDTLTVTHDVYH